MASAALNAVLFEERRWWLTRQVDTWFVRRQLSFALLRDLINARRGTAENPASAEGHERLWLAHCLDGRADARRQGPLPSQRTEEHAALPPRPNVRGEAGPTAR